MSKILLSFIVMLLTGGQVFSQDGLNQVIIVNSGQFGNPSERATIASLDPVDQVYRVIDTLPSNSIQDCIIDGDFAYIAAQGSILKYDLDSYELISSAIFPGVSAHQLEISGENLFATNFYGQESGNLYVFDKNSLSVLDTVEEITHPGGTMALFGNRLYISQNQKGNTDACPPFGCLNDTLGYLSVVDAATGQWLANISLDNNGNECGRILRNGSILFSLNEVSNTVTAYQPSSGENITQAVFPDINTSRYRTEAEVVGGFVISLFGGGIGILSQDIMSAEVFIDTPVTAFAYDLVNDDFYAVATDFFSSNRGYAFSSSGNHLFDFPVGINPEAVAVHYNRQPVGNEFETESRDTILIDVNSIASDPDGDNLAAERVENAPVNGVIEILEDGSIRYVSLSPGSADFFRIEVCDEKLNPLCSFIEVTILPVSFAASSIFAEARVFPNPVRGSLFIDNPVENVIYELANGIGAVLIRTHDIRIEMSDLPDGIYFLRMIGDDNSRVFPVLKQ